MMDEVLLAARGLTRYYGIHQVLHNIDMSLRRGEVLGFLGQNGAGKSTTMQILSGALMPSSGRVEICGASLATEPLEAKAELGYLPEVPPLYSDMLVDEYLSGCARLRRVEAGAIAEAVVRCRARCGLADVGQRLIGHLSKGYQQRVGIAQAIVHEPSVLVFDEPTAGLDPVQIRDVRALIRELGRDRAIIVSTHILPEVQTLASRIVILHHGRVVYDAPVAAASRWMRVRFLQDPGAGALAALIGVKSVTAAEDGWVLEVEDAKAVAVAVTTRAVSANWGLLELHPNYDALEQLFMRLTTGGDSAAIAA